MVRAKITGVFDGVRMGSVYLSIRSSPNKIFYLKFCLPLPRGGQAAREYN